MSKKIVRKQGDRSWLDVLQHVGQAIGSFVAFALSVRVLMEDFAKAKPD